MSERSKIGTWPKILRADEQLHAIRTEIALYQHSQPYSVRGQLHPDCTTFTANLQRREFPPYRISLQVGEFIYNLHSALDQLADFLVRHSNGCPATDTYFPILKTEPCQPKRGPRSLPHVAGGVTTRIAEALDELQPYKAQGDDVHWHPLAIVKALSKIDKHRNLLVADTTVGQSSVILECRGVAYQTIVFGILEEDTEIASFTLPEPVAPEEVKVNGQFSLDVTFSETEPPERQPVAHVLDGCLSYVREVVVPTLEKAVYGPGS